MIQVEGTTIVKSVELTHDEVETIQRISSTEYLSEMALLRKFILEGMARYRLQEAVAAYQRGEIDLSRAARYAGLSVYQMMDELQRRGVEINVSTEKFIDGLEGFVEDYGGSQALRQMITRLRERPDPLTEL